MISLTDPVVEIEVSPQRLQLGHTPRLFAIVSIGVLVVSIGYAGSRASGAGSTILFWIGLLIIFVPTAVRMLHTAVPRFERITLLLITGMGLYGVKLAHSPAGFAFIDEFIHWRGAQDIERTGQLLTLNPLLPIAESFPGFAAIVASVSSVSGVSNFVAAIIVVGLARVVLITSLFVILERVSGSGRVAGVACMLYMTNPAFVFVHGQFIYESLAIALAAAVIVMFLHFVERDHAGRMLLLGALGTIAVVVTHHLTSYLLVAFTIGWASVSALGGRPWRRPAAVALTVAVAAGGWLMIAVGPSLASQYLGEPLWTALVEGRDLISGRSGGRAPFENAQGGSVPPAWERIVSLGSVALVLIGLPYGFVRLVRDPGRGTLATLLAVGMFAYPMSLALRLTQAGQEAGFRASPFIFLSAALGLALTIDRILGATDRPVRIAVVTSAAAFILVGGVIAGVESWLRTPGPYLVSASARTVDGSSIAASMWVSNHLEPNGRVVSDQMNRQLLGTIGRQFPVTQYNSGTNIAQLFFSPTFGATEEQLIKSADIDFVVIDRRLSTSLPRSGGVYFESYETGERFARYDGPIGLAALEKFEPVPGISKIYDSGDIAVFDVSEVGRG